MAIREVIQVPNDRLRQKANTIVSFIPELKQLTQDMFETMRHHNGVGLAGPQIGVLQRIFVAEIRPTRLEQGEPHPQSGASYIIINPKIIGYSNQLAEGQEGCLSMPGWAGLVERPNWVEVQGQSIEDQPLKVKVDGLLARIFQHEIDHLNGILYTDHITDSEKLWQVAADEENEE